MIDWARANGWEINDGPKNVFLKDHDTVFKLDEDTSSGSVRYRVSFDDGFMPEPWRNATFEIRGQSPLVWSEDAHDVWSKSEQTDYNSAIGMVMQDASTDTLRLEAEIEIDGKKNMIILLGAENAVK